MLKKACTRFCMNSGSELGFGHKINKILKFGDDFELQLADEYVQDISYHSLLVSSNEPKK